MINTLRIATRKSQLALWQAEFVASELEKLAPDVRVELVKMSTQGDRVLDSPLAKIGGKGLFIKELEQALLNNEADLAVHSTKDMPALLPEGLQITAICKREDPRDAFVSSQYGKLSELPDGARVGTSSLRRQCQIRARYPKLEIHDLRGNVNTRLKKLDAGEYDAIILAAAGLIRLGFQDRITNLIEIEESLPAVGQGAVCIETVKTNKEVNQLVAKLNDSESACCVLAERAMNARLEGGCQVPIGGYAQLVDETLTMRGLVGQIDGKKIISDEIEGHFGDAEQLGSNLAARLLEQGAKDILENL